MLSEQAQQQLRQGLGPTSDKKIGPTQEQIDDTKNILSESDKVLSIIIEKIGPCLTCDNPPEEKISGPEASTSLLSELQDLNIRCRIHLQNLARLSERIVL